ncbi:hypothetical protein WA026_009074 [Henosepilachna vigintioctopunctata]|uniref:Uncharacterized protein n=1 Tax=Henosepilachna vigintioctopunctata TaxID=420089 RepID=A0AAW1UUN2_9CUCU
MAYKTSDVVFDGSVIEFSDTVKNLGVVFDSGLSFREHTIKTLSKGYATLKYLYSFKNFISSPIKWKITCSLIMSLFNYCSPLYFTLSTKAMQSRVQKLQNS